jgi:hypothetical protein
MSEKMIRLIFTPQQAKALCIAVKLSKEMMMVAPNTPVYPNLGNFELERDLTRAELAAAQETLLRQMEEQMPKE